MIMMMILIFFRWAGSNMRYDLDTNVTVVTLPINNTLYPCRYINDRHSNMLQKIREKHKPF